MVACPDPHVERWYLADPAALSEQHGASVAVTRENCERDYCKALLADCLRAAGETVTLGGVEFAEEIVGSMDLFAAGKNVVPLGRFVDSLRGALKMR